MADAWTNLKLHSTLVIGDAWEHLLHQEGGGGGTCYGAKNGLVFSLMPSTKVFSLTSGEKAFKVTPSVFDFSVSRAPITLKCKSVALTFHLTKVLS